jgi:hypothetical protein
MTETNGVVDEGFLRRYRELLDAEEEAFDELEHSWEDGDREHFELDLTAWHRAVDARNEFLARRGLPESPKLVTADL